MRRMAALVLVALIGAGCGSSSRSHGDGSIAHAIDIDETGASQIVSGGLQVWTDADTAGGTIIEWSCGNWANASANAPNGLIGSNGINLALIGVIWWSAHRLTWDCTLIDDGRACALEYNVVRWGETELQPEAGIAVYVRGENGRLAAARIYDDVDPPLGSAREGARE